MTLYGYVYFLQKRVFPHSNKVANKSKLNETILLLEDF